MFQIYGTEQNVLELHNNDESYHHKQSSLIALHLINRTYHINYD